VKGSLLEMKGWSVGLKPGRQVVAGETGRWMLDICLGEDILPGDVLRLEPDFLRVKWDIGDFFFSSASSHLMEHRRVYPSISNPGASFESVLEGELTDGRLGKGELLRLYLGDYSRQGRDWRAPKLACEGVMMRLSLRKAGDGLFRTVAEIPVDIVPAGTSRLAAHFISPAGDASELFVSSLDPFGNITNLNGEVVAYAIDSEGCSKALASLTLCDGRGRATVSNLMNASGGRPAWLYAELSDNPAITSPRVPFSPGFMRDAGLNIYFGETHLHCEGSHNDGMNSPAFVYDYATHVSGMGFCAITDHVGKIKDGFWMRQRAIAKKRLEPGVFVPILAYEWDSMPLKGHSGVFVKGDLEKVVEGDSIEELWRGLESAGLTFFTRPNHVNSAAEHLPLLPVGEVKAWRNYDWSQHNDKYQPLAEIVTPRGSSEKEGPGDGVLADGYGSSMDSALKQGFHIGFTGGSDDHTGRSGNVPEDCWLIDKPSLRTGITAVLAAKLDIDSLWRAFTGRNTYATTGAKMLLDFRVNGLVMGSRQTFARPGEANVKIKVLGTDEIVSVCIIRNGDVLKELKPGAPYFECDFIDRKMTFSLPCHGGVGGHACYYLRVVQRDGHIAWTSPVFICESLHR
jgi:hypothetical protein